MEEASVDEASGQCKICRAFDKAPQIPIAGTSAVPTFHGKLQVNPSFSDDAVALRAVDASPSTNS